MCICWISCTETETYAHVGLRDGGPVFRAPLCTTLLHEAFNFIVLHLCAVWIHELGLLAVQNFYSALRDPTLAPQRHKDTFVNFLKCLSPCAWHYFHSQTEYNNTTVAGHVQWTSHCANLSMHRRYVSSLIDTSLFSKSIDFMFQLYFAQCSHIVECFVKIHNKASD
jgi:hypothetical protein